MDHVSPTKSPAESPAESLAASYSGLVCDLDGVVYRGSQAVPHAVAELTAARAHGTRLIFATNNASRPPSAVADSLRKLGLELDDADVLTSSLAGARHLEGELTQGAAVLAVGGPGVADALRSVGLQPVLPGEARDASVEAVLQGYGPDVTAAHLGEAAYAIQRGARWVATNNDLTLPTDRGMAPGNGSLVAAVGQAVDADPIVVGKPGPLLYQLAAQALGTDAEATLGVGDRLETDTAGAHAAGMDALHVLTGVHGPADLVRATPELRPRFVGLDLRVLHDPYVEPVRAGEGRWTVGESAGVLDAEGDSTTLRFQPADGRDDLPWIQRLRLALRLLWEALDAGLLSPEEAVAALPPQQ